jgi:hypothetical protein
MMAMLPDLDQIHETILDAYKAVMLLADIDLEAEARKPFRLPTGHVPI